jgi:uncharacterized membrane protein
MSQEVKQADTHTNKAAEKHQQPNEQSLAATNEQPLAVTAGLRRGPVIVALVLLVLLAVGGGYAIWCASADFADLATRMTFMMGSALNLAVFLAILAQACIYWGQRNLMHKQWEAMQAGLNETRRMVTSAEEQAKAVKEQVEIMGIAIEPRLRITNVRIVNLKAEERPAFIIWIVNEGATDAKNVKFYMRVALGTEEQHWSREQTITIPARKEEHYWIAWSNTLGQNDIDAINGSIPVKVTGYFNIENRGQQEFCYRYYPWKGRRPRNVSQFIPCDFNPGLTVPLAGHAEGGATVASNLTTQQKQGQKGSDDS